MVSAGDFRNGVTLEMDGNMFRMIPDWDSSNEENGVF